MPDRWQTYPIEFRGGLISNLSPLQHGAAAPGSARNLTNFEVSTEGGYRRIEGFSKFNSNIVTGQNNILGVTFFRDSAITARDQTSGDPKLYAGTSGTGAWTDLSTSLTLGANTSRVRFCKYNFDGNDKLFIVDGIGYPLILAGVTASDLSQLSGPSDLQGATHAVEFKEHIFAAKGENLVFSAPFEDDDFTAASGGGIINVGSTITDLIVFREQLIVFSEDRISRIVGNSIADFQMQPITDNIGCVVSDTAQEISGDVIFLGPDGLRTVAGTERNQDFELASISKPIQKQMVQLASQNSSFASVVIREKSQYRIFGFTGSSTAGTSKGIIGTQIQDQQGIAINWSETTGIKAFTADSTYSGTTETVLFGHNDGYIYQMESGNSFDGNNIVASFSTPYFPISDPRLRKTVYKTTVYTDPQGTINLSLNLKYDLSETGVIEPSTVSLENTSSAGGVFIFGEPSVQFADGGKINNGGGYSSGVSSMVVDLMSLDSTSSPTLDSGDTFQVITNSSSSANFEKTYTLSSKPTITGNASATPSTATTTLAFTPNLAASVADNDDIIFTTVGGVNNTAVFSGETLKSIFDNQAQGSGFTVSLQFSSDDTNPPYSLDATVLEYGQYGRR
tara:strand:- start:1407 stop:3272 length:1866 start_codon:yes stop_codon:yes gene_type:complete